MTPVLAEIPVLFAAAGAVGGSFTATAVLRSLRHQQALDGRSSCDHCDTALAYGQTIPLVSYILNRGACRACAGRIDPFHLSGEAVGALIGLCAGTLFAFASAGPVKAVSLLVLGFSLLALSLVDLRTYRIPNTLTGVVLLAGSSFAASTGLDRLGLNFVWAAVCFGGLSLVRLLFARLRGEQGLGFGDVKLLAALAAWLGPLTPYALIAACVMALIGRVASGKLSGRTAFAPWIALGAWAVGMTAEVVPWPA